ncbi:MAG: HAD family hydrolase [Nitrospirota bacterium]
MNRKLLVLDLDETLIFSCEKALERPADFIIDDEYYIYRRPHLDEFLSYVFQNFLISVWTSSSVSYASAILQVILTGDQHLEFLWDRERCTPRYNHERDEHYWVKNLDKLKKKGYPLESVIMIDDSPEKIEKNYGNHIRVSEYTGQEDDNDLLFLMHYLDALKDEKNIRLIEKRGWKSRYFKAPGPADSMLL